MVREITAGDIATMDAWVTRKETYQDQIRQFKDRNYTYIPMPADGIYYTNNENLTRDLTEGHYIKPDEPLEVVFDRLLEYAFLLVTSEANNRVVIVEGEVVGHFATDDEGYRWLEFDDDAYAGNGLPEPNDYYDDDQIVSVPQLETEYPSIANQFHSQEYDSRYGIITLADLNKRATRDSIYPKVSQLAYYLSAKIENQYPDDEDILVHLRPETVGRWYKSKMSGTKTHISEQMTLSEMQQVIRSSDSEFVEECGFRSKSQVRKKLGSVNALRNKVMHANKSLVRDRKDLEQLVERLEIIENLIDELESSTEHNLMR